MRILRRWLALCLLLALVSVGGVAQEKPASIESALLSLQSNLATLKLRLSERSIELKEAKRQVEMLRTELTAARLSLENSLTHLAASRQEIGRLTDLLTQSQATLRELDASFLAYQTESVRRVRLWQTATVVAVVVAVLSFLK